MLGRHITAAFPLMEGEILHLPRFPFSRPLNEPMAFHLEVRHCHLGGLLVSNRLEGERVTGRFSIGCHGGRSCDVQIYNSCRLDCCYLLDESFKSEVKRVKQDFAPGCQLARARY
jgi:hypothetical protein